ncbi:MAG: hypothetical protein HY275_19725 [Gemmatimonadetes bacterium]|nr:hypothetical protein [Gemmatimonadota bacterium]
MVRASRALPIALALSATVAIGAPAQTRHVSTTFNDAASTSLGSSGLSSLLQSLFRFGSTEVELSLPGSTGSGLPGVIVHGSHFIPSAVASNGSLLGFVTNFIGGAASNVPLTSAGGGTTFRFENGVPVATTISPGPIFAERAQTLGRGRAAFGVTRTQTEFNEIRGVPLKDLRLVFTHQNITNAEFPGCDSLFAGNCNQMGFPAYENDVIRVDLNLQIQSTVTSFFFTYGLTDFMDLSVTVPFVQTSLRGTSVANIDPFGGTVALHYFAGTFSQPVLQATKSVEGDASGVGDVSARLKIGLGSGPKGSMALLLDGRFATGNANDLLGSGAFAGRALAVLSARFDNFSPHLNAGYLYRAGDIQNSAVLGTIGFDHLMAPWAMIACDLLTEFQVGENKVQLPQKVNFDYPFARTMDVSNIPNTRDDIVNASFGVKLRTFDSFNTVANVLIPLNKGGLRPNLLWTLGAEYNF